MKKHIALAISLGLAATVSAVRADDLSNNFSANINQTSLDALAQDLGALAGGGSFHSGKSLGFPIGFDVGVHVPIVGVSDDNAILKDDGSTANGGWVNAEVGLPANFDIIGRVGKIMDADGFGAGLRYGILDPSVPGLPSISISALYNDFSHDYFDMTTLSANLVVSFDVPLIHPYVGAGYDSTKLEPTSMAFAGATPGTDTSLEGEASGYRVEAGVNLSIIPFTYITLGGGLANGEELYHAGLGVRF